MENEERPRSVHIKMVPPAPPAPPASPEPPTALLSEADSSIAQFNEALEWLHYSRGSAKVLADYLHEAEAVDIKETALAIDAVAAMIRQGADRMARAHSLLRWEYAEKAGLVR